MLLKKIMIFAFTLVCLNFTRLNAQTVKDADGNIYVSISIGKQIWLAENLKTTKFNNGSQIQLVTDEKAWKELRTPAYCCYGNDIKNKDVYGVLYNWFTVKTGKLCPQGWHVPSDTEWRTMVGYLGDINKAADKLKEAGVEHWKNYPSTSTNDFDFTALPGGTRLYSGVFPTFGSSYAVWWTSTEYSSLTAWNWGLHDRSSSAYNGYDNKQCGFSVRCVQD